MGNAISNPGYSYVKSAQIIILNFLLDIFNQQWNQLGDGYIKCAYKHFNILARLIAVNDLIVH